MKLRIYKDLQLNSLFVRLFVLSSTLEVNYMAESLSEWRWLVVSCVSSPIPCFFAGYDSDLITYLGKEKTLNFG